MDQSVLNSFEPRPLSRRALLKTILGGSGVLLLAACQQSAPSAVSTTVATAPTAAAKVATTAPAAAATAAPVVATAAPAVAATAVAAAPGGATAVAKVAATAGTARRRWMIART